MTKGMAVLRSFGEIVGYVVRASDGDLGSVQDIRFDDQWSIRFIVLDANDLLILPEEIGVIDHHSREMMVFSEAGTLRSASVSDKQRVEMAKYSNEMEPMKNSPDEAIQSARGVSGYHVQARDGVAGHLADIIIDMREWTVRYFVVDPREWMSGPIVLVPVGRVEVIDGAARVLRVDMDRTGVAGREGLLSGRR